MSALLPIALWAIVAQAAMTPTAPGPGAVFLAGSNCTLQWIPDPTGTWRNVSIDLMSGANLDMSVVQNVAQGLDGTDPSLTPYIWPCPAVDPYSAIYFYQFTQSGQEANATWTTRFAIASADGNLTLPEHSTQPNGDAIAWGYGHLATSTSPFNSSTLPPTNSSIALAMNGTTSAMPNATATSLVNTTAPTPTASGFVTSIITSVVLIPTAIPVESLSAPAGHLVMSASSGMIEPLPTSEVLVSGAECVRSMAWPAVVSLALTAQWVGSLWA